MSLPKQTEMFSIVLNFMGDGKPYSRKDLREMAKERLQLTPEELKQRTSSGKQTYASRVDWSVSNLYKAHLIDKVSRGTYRINDSGINLLNRQLSLAEFNHELNAIMANEKLSENSVASAPDHDIEVEEQSEVSPEELIDNAVNELEDSLANEILNLLLKIDPKLFETVVVNLLEAMGYGKGSVTSYSNDGGIDGIVSTDELGFSPIFTQAKLYSLDRKVGREDLQKFAGALNGAQNGVFITTSSFNNNAIEFARNFKASNIVLVNGKKLAHLMIKHGLGVSTERTIYVHRLDEDYFENLESIL